MSMLIRIGASPLPRPATHSVQWHCQSFGMGQNGLAGRGSGLAPTNLEML